MRVIIPLMITLLVCGAIVLATRAVVRTLVQRQASAVLARPETAAIDPAAYRNHLGMARWIEARLKDDLVRSALEPADDVRARQLLEQFYGEEQT